VRLTGATFITIHIVVILFSLLKGKYTLALIGVFITPVAVIAAIRIARPESIWAKRRYREARLEKAQRREDEINRRYRPMLRRWQNLVGGAPSRPDPDPGP
jgi:hypothetical protein